MGVALLLISLVVLAVAAGLRPAGPAEIDEFVAAAGIRTTETSRRFIGHYLASGRRLRTVLVVGALVVPGLLAEALGVRGTGYTASFPAVLIACVVGTLWAELVLTRPMGERRAASLLPRRPAVYLARPLRAGPAVAGAASAVVWAGVPLLPEAQPGEWQLPAGGEVVLGLATGVAVLVLAPVAQRSILGRPQPFVTDDLLAADHAVRAASVRMVAALTTI